MVHCSAIHDVSLMVQEIIDHMLSPKTSHKCLSVLVGLWAGSLLGESAVDQLVHHHADHPHAGPMCPLLDPGPKCADSRLLHSPAMQYLQQTQSRPNPALSSRPTQQ